MRKEKIVIKEKERYEWNSRFDEAIKDNQTGDIVNAVEVLNQQDKRIKELEEELDDAKRDYIPKLEFALQRANKMGRDAEKENQQLKHQLAESEKPKEIRFNGFVVDCNYNEARKVLQENLFKMQAENKKLKESEELSNYAKCILKNKKLEEDIELSKKCCVEYEQEIQELKKQLHDLPKKIVEEINEELHDCGRTYIEDEPYIEICIVKGILAKIYRKY